MGQSQDVIGDRMLNEIALPGTHDSGTYSITSSGDYADDGNMDPVAKWVNGHEGHWYTPIIKPVLNYITNLDKQVVASWAHVQQANFLQQLTDGIRYIDLRVQDKNGQYVIVHSLTGGNLTDLMTAIKTFYAMPGTDKEILLLDFNHTFDMDDTAFIAWLKASLVDANGNSLLIPRGSDLHLNNIWATNQRIILFYDDDTTVSNDPDLWYSYACSTPQIDSDWPNDNNQSDLANYWNAKLNDRDIQHYQWSGNFFVWQAIGTEQESDVIACIETLAVKGHSGLAHFLEKTLHFHTSSPTDFLDWNAQIARPLLESWANDSGDKALIINRANIIIIDDYQNFTYSGGGYLNLIQEINTARNAQIPLCAIVKSQSNVNLENFTGTARIVFTNKGTSSWDPQTLHLGTSSPHDRMTDLYTNDGNWISYNRIKMQNTAPVAPGQDAVFEFTLTADSDFTTSYQTFELVIDQGAGWFGEYQGSASILVTLDLTTYQAQLKSQSPDTTITRFSNQTLQVVFTNVGNVPWLPDIVMLGSSNPQDRYTGIYSNDGNWVSQTRIRMQNTDPVQPGQDAVFEFAASPTIGTASMEQTFELVADRAFERAPAQWVGAEGTASINVNVAEPSTSVQLDYKSPDATIPRGQGQLLTIAFKNTGSTPLDPSVLLLSPSNPQYRDSHLFTNDGNWISTEYIQPQNMNQLVQPGDDVVFEFTATPDSDCQTQDQTFEMLILLPYVYLYWYGDPGTATIHVTVTD
ncbi:MAG: hypothetical protein V2A78_07975 [bacterium]